jgi:quercetin dioxygenase-like cupin family protein
MASADRVSAVAPDALSPGDETPGIEREVAFATDRGLLIRSRVEPGNMTGWHHHGDRDVLGHVARGRARFEFGPEGRSSTDVEEGGFFHVPARLVHRDVNPEDVTQELILSFVGHGPLVVNVDGPDPG